MLLLTLLACQNSGTVFVADALTETTPPTTPEPLALTVDEPAAFAFIGDGEVTVSGRVSDPSAIVWVEGHRVTVGTGGAFLVTVPVEGYQRHIDIEASNPTAHLRERRPVLSGDDPLAAWPGAVTLRFTPLGVEHLAELVEAQIVTLDLAGQLEAILPDLAVAGFSATPIGLDTWPASAVMTPGPDGLDLTVTVPRVVLTYAIVSGTFLGDGDVALGFDPITIGATVQPLIDASGVLTLQVTDTDISLGQPVITLGGASSPALENLLGGAIGGITGFLEGALDGLLVGIGSLELFGPIAFDFDLFGTPIALSVDRLATDDDGVAGVLGVDLGVGGGGVLRVPTAEEAGERADLAVALHEGIFQPLLQSEILDLLEQDIVLDGLVGELLGAPIVALPGGDEAPEDRTGWCLALGVGDGRVARLADEGLTPMATLVLPEVFVNIGVNRPGVACEPWLDVSLAIEADLSVRTGTVLGIDLRIVDGVVLNYATPDDWEEQEVIEGLGALIGAATTLLGASLEIDLAEILGDLSSNPLLGDVNLRLLDSVPAETEAGEPIAGLKVISLSIWD
jgi:hypothetical protein